MTRRLIVLSIASVALVLGQIELSACGDKFLRVGRSGRFFRYASVHPAAILIYQPVNSTPKGIKELEMLLRRAGHRALAVENGAALVNDIGGAPIDLVIADYADTTRLEQAAAALPSRPTLLPILYKPTRAVAEEAEKAYHFLLKPHAMTKAQALAEIDQLMTQRIKPTAAAASR